MYRKDSDNWLKHWDFILWDMACLQLAFILAYAMAGYGFNPYKVIIYRNMAIFIEMADIVIMFLMGTLKNVLKRGYYVEISMTIRHGVGLGAVSILYLFLLQQGQLYSRLSLLLTFPTYIVISYIVRVIWKNYLWKRSKIVENRSLLIVSTKNHVEQVIRDMRNYALVSYAITGVVVIDEDLTGKLIEDVRVVANKENAADYVCKNWVDEVFVVIPELVPYPKELVEQFVETGVVVHTSLSKILNLPGKKQFVESMGNYTVLTTSINYASSRQLLAKRLMDIVGGLLGCILTAILFVFVAPAIYISSPGPIFFSQERVGKNGKTFKMYKFRSMYIDAEERKAALMKDNKLGDGKMFKLDFDPRVIGNKILPDGRKKTGIGDFIRRSSIDEFPQFFNVLKGDMSIVGTRPPLISETKLYELHHRARLAIKPGITGMWQVSGRSDITDFEEVVRLDTEYISNWSIALDLRILAKTIKTVLKKDGSM